MKKWFMASALALVMVVPALADGIYYPPHVIGARDRSSIRHYLFARNLTGDKLDVYNEYGYPVHRLRTNEYGKVLEHWRYYEVGKEFVFDQCSDLVDTKSIDEEHRRSWAYQRDVAGYDEDLPCDE